MAWQQNWSQSIPQPLGNFAMPGISSQPQMGPYPLQYNPTMTPEQHFAVQQNWQQWQTYQQQYAQWQAQYGEKYQQEMQQKFNHNATMMPPMIPQATPTVAPMLPLSQLPPPPPNQPAPLPPPPPEVGFTDASKQTGHLSDNQSSNQRSFQPELTGTTGTINRTTTFMGQQSNNRSDGQQQFNRIGVGMIQNVNHSALPSGRSQFESINPSTSFPSPNQPLTRSLNSVVDDASDKTPEEKAFDEQFKKWEEEFANWKLQNANHPDTRAYMEYEQKMEECRTKLLERREQMKRRKLELQQQQQQQQQEIQINSIPPSRIATNVEQLRDNVPSQMPIAYEKNDRISDQLVQSEVSNDSKGEMFMRHPVGSAAAGIPGLDLVVDKSNEDSDDKDLNDRTSGNVRSTKFDGISQKQSSNYQQRPDLEAISRGLNSILGDPNLVSLLSNFQAPKAASNPTTKPAIPSLLDMKMPDIDLDQVPRFNWKDDDDDDDDESNSSVPQQHANDSSNNVRPVDSVQANSNQLMDNNCDDDPYDDDFDADMEHERFAEPNVDDSNQSFPQSFQMNNIRPGREDGDSFSDFTKNSRTSFNRNDTTMDRGGNFGTSNRQFNSNFMNNDGPNENFNQNRLNFNDNMRGNNTFVGAGGTGNGGNFNQQNSMNVQGNRMNSFDQSPLGNNSNFMNDRNQMNCQQGGSNFGGGNNFGNNFKRQMMDDQFSHDNSGMRNDDRSDNMNDFCRRRNYNDRNFNDLDGSNVDNSNSQLSFNFRNNNRFDDNNQSELNSQQISNVQNRTLPTETFTSDNAKDEDFFRPTKVIDYSATSMKPLQTTPKDDILMPMKVVDYGHQTRSGIVSRPRDNLRPRPANKYTGDDFFPVKTIDYNHSSNKHKIKEYYYSIVSKWNPDKLQNVKSTQPQQVSTKPATGGNSNNEPDKSKVQLHSVKPTEMISSDRLSEIDTTTNRGKRLKRALVMKRSTVDDYAIGHKFYPSVKWQLLNEESRIRPGLPTKRGKRKHKNGTINPTNKTIRPLNDTNDFEEIVSNDEDSLEEYDMKSVSGDDKKDKPEEQIKKIIIKNPSPVRARPVRQNVVLIEDLLYNPGRKARPHKIVIIMRGAPGSGKTFLAKLIKDKETENGGVAVRILSIDDYFKTEVDETRKCTETGKTINVKKMIYEYEKEMEDTYMQYLIKSYKKTVVDGLFDFIIVDSINSTLRHYTEFYNFAKVYAFTPYTCELEMNPDICFKRNIHQRTLEEIKSYCNNWSKTPEQYLKLDFDSFVEDVSSFEIDDN